MKIYCALALSFLGACSEAALPNASAPGNQAPVSPGGPGAADDPSCIDTCSSRDAGASDDGGAAADAGLPPAVDPVCMLPGSHSFIFPAFVPLSLPSVPANCSGGFEINNPVGKHFSFTAKPSAGAAAITLDIDLATYLEPDTIVITGIDASGASYTLFDSCRMRTWTKADPTDGCHRPPDETIRQFHADVRAGTKSLTFDFSGEVSPIYLRVLGLCDFAVHDPGFNSAHCGSNTLHFRAL